MRSRTLVSDSVRYHRCSWAILLVIFHRHVQQNDPSIIFAAALSLPLSFPFVSLPLRGLQDQRRQPARGYFCAPALTFNSPIDVRNPAKSSPLYFSSHAVNDDNDNDTGNDERVVVHVGNLDWKIPSAVISQQLLNLLYSDATLSILSDNNNGDNKNNNNPNEGSIKIEVKELHQPIRTRDKNKCHGGSARITFQSNHLARLGMEALNSYANHVNAANTLFNGDGNLGASGGSTPNKLRIKWAIPTPIQDNEEKKVLTQERIELRKERADSYARRRRRVAKKTDHIIQHILMQHPNKQQHHDSDDGLTLLRDLSTLDAPTLDWSQCPAAIDPIKGGGLQKGTTRGQRKRAAVEAFLLVVKSALLDRTRTKTTDDDMNMNMNMKMNKNDANGTKQNERTMVADLGCGAGNLAIPLAWWLREEGYGVLGVDINAVALNRLTKRANGINFLDTHADSQYTATDTAPANYGIQTLQEDLLHLINYKDNTDDDTHNPQLSQTHHPLYNCAAIVSLHACGAASDLSMAAAVRYSLPFAISPCCIGKVNVSRLKKETETRLTGPGGGGRMPRLKKLLSSNEWRGAPSQVSYPRSTWLTSTLNSTTLLGNHDGNDIDLDLNLDSDMDECYRMLAAAADYGVVEHPDMADEQELDRRKRCRMAKRIIEKDRMEWARERGYYVRMLELPRIGPTYPKRELLLGARVGSAAAGRIARL